MFTPALVSGREFNVLDLMRVMAIGRIKRAETYFVDGIWGAPLLHPI